MAYGGLDRRVPLIHGEKMRDALRSRNVPVEWVVYAEEAHGFLVEAEPLRFLSAGRRVPRPAPPDRTLTEVSRSCAGRRFRRC